MTRIALRGRAALPCAVVLACCGCGDDAAPPGRDAGMIIPSVDMANRVAFEGHERFVTAFVSIGDDLTGATITPTDASTPLDVVESRCNRVRCAVVLRVRDTTPNRGVGVPAPIDSRIVTLDVTLASGALRHAPLSIFPLDSITNASSMPVAVHDTVIAASADTQATSIFRAAVVGGPLRWVVYGPATFRGTLDVSAEGAEARAGGRAGGAAGAAAAGSGAGAAGAAGAGAGGGGGHTAGDPGDAADGTAGGGGSGGAATIGDDGACAIDFGATECGGGGGGGGAGSGGAGGGTLVLAAVGPLDLTGATLRARGGDGTDGGGGGGGGAIVIAGAPSGMPSAVDVAGGAGGVRAMGAGGAGGAGLVRVDAIGGPAIALPSATRGPAVDVSALAALTDTDTVDLSGVAPPGTSDVSFTEVADGTVLATATPAADGTFSASVTMRPGLNRLRVTARVGGAVVRSWTGTSFEYMDRLPIGGVIDIAYVPPGE